MQLFHTSDWHLGRMLYGRSLLEDQRHFLEEQFLPAVEEERPACVLLAGDLYDRQVAPPEAIALLDRTLSRLVELEVPVCAIAGNHDGPSRIAILKSALRRAGVYLATQLEDAFAPVTIEQGGQAVQVFLLPYFDTAQVRDFLGDETLKGENACMEALLHRMLPLFAPGAAHVLVAHCFAAGSQTCDSESVALVGGSGQVSPGLFEAFDYVALGHLHGPQKAGEKARYSGSPLKYSIDEAGQKKGFLTLTWDGTAMAAELRPTRPLRDVGRLTGQFQDLLARGEASPCQDYVELVLEDQEPVLLAAERLRPYYPNLLSVSHPKAFAMATAGQRAAKLQNQDQATVFASFLKDVCQIEPEEEDLALFREVRMEVAP